ncbi:MAG: hypothetical protein GXO71_02565 [Caldiserica bacterium]|nr:hypothetical protein [Caldisericota bacterium]
MSEYTKGRFVLEAEPEVKEIYAKMKILIDTSKGIEIYREIYGIDGSGWQILP